MIKFKQPQLLAIALTHRSAINEKKGLSISNERMEFLGDAILELVVSDYLYHQFPDWPEGQLTAKRAQIVQTKTLAAEAKELKLGPKLIMSKGEKKAGGDKNPSLLANTFEALIGAIYLDQGIDTATKFIHESLLKSLPNLLKQIETTDFKSQLQEKWQKTYRIAPAYKLVSALGPDHDKTFIVRVYRGRQLCGEGRGKSKQAAEQTAARQAIEKKNNSC